MANGFFSYYLLPIHQDVGWVEYCDIFHAQGNDQLNPTY